MDAESGPFEFTEPRRTRRQEFYDTLTTIGLAEADQAIRRLAEAWRKATHADISMIWLLSDARADAHKAGRLQLAGAAGGPERWPDELADKHCTQWSMGTCAIDADEVQGHRDARAWCRTLGEREYRSSMCGLFVEHLEAPGLVCVPLAPAGGGAESDSESGPLGGIRGVVSLHYRKPADARIFRKPEGETKPGDRGSLRFMGRLSAMVLANLWREQKIIASAELAALAATHLTRQREEPRKVRREYLDGVITLIRKQLNFRYVTVFSRVPFERRVAAVASTGLFPTVGTGRIVPDEFSKFGFNAGTGVVGAAYRDHQVSFLDAADERAALDDRMLGASELTPSADPGSRGLTVVLPIAGRSESLDDSDSAEEPVAAVIRCSGQQNKVGADLPRHFDPTEFETLQFIAEQIAPVLLTLESRIMREDVISVVKHDLLVPMHSIRDAVDFITDPPAGTSGQSLEYYLANLRQSSLRLGGLVDQLSRDLFSKRAIKPRRTNLGSEIVAPLKRMMTPFAQEFQTEIRFDGFDGEGGLPMLNVDPALIERAIYNLVMNALKYGHKRDSTRQRANLIQILASRVPGGFAIDVVNEGPGVAPEDEPFLFTMHFRSRMARATREGTGLGLSVVRQIMVSHGGRATLLHPKDPTVFRLFLPERLKA